MSKKQALRPRNRAGTNDSESRALLERMLLKRNYKDAVKQAKAIYRAESTSENRGLLERAYFLRAEQLDLSGLKSSAIEVTGHLLEFGVTDPRVTTDLPGLLLRLGLTRDALRIQGQAESPEGQSRLIQQAADRLVLHPASIQPPSPEVGREAAAVRQALELLTEGDEPGALELLREIARSSPLSEWRLFLRGLAAFYRHEQAESQANWARLDPDRAPRRIAAQIERLNRDAPSELAGEAELGALEDIVFGERIIPGLRQLSELAGKNRWADLLRRLRPLQSVLGRVDARISDALTGALIPHLIRQASTLDYRSGARLISEFTRVAQPLSIDPSWNRLWALVWENPGGDLTESVKFWTRYITDLESATGLSAEERPLAQAMIWSRIAKLDLDRLEAGSNEEGDGFVTSFQKIEDLDLKTLRRHALECLDRSIALAPGHRPTYDLLVRANQRSNEPGSLQEAWRRIIRVFPEDTDTLIQLAISCQGGNEPALALSYIERARKLKPLDPILINQEVEIRASLARNLALAKQWDQGRAQFATIERLKPEEGRNYVHLAHKAIFETKAHELARAKLHQTEALALLAEPAPFWLVMRVESIRYKLPMVDRNRYSSLWNQELRKKRRSETAGAMAAFLAGFATRRIEYTGIKSDTSSVVDYLDRTTTLSYRLDDLEEVCAFLDLQPTQSGLIEKLAAKGLKDHGESALMHMLAARSMVARGPFGGLASRALVHLETALRLAEASTRPRDLGLVPQIKETLSVLRDSISRSAALGFGLPDSLPTRNTIPRSIEDLINAFLGANDDDDTEDDDDDDDDEMDFGSFFEYMFSAQRSKPRSKRKRRK